MWLTTEEIMALPTTGSPWQTVLSAANSAWGNANLSDNNSKHDVLTLAGALVAVRNNDAAIRSKVAAALESAVKSPLARALEASRGLQTYVIAADIVDYRDNAFKAWVEKTVTAPIQGHSGGTGILGTATHSSTNWGGHCRASLAAAAIYTGRVDFKDAVVAAQRTMVGLPAPGNEMKFDGTDWHAGTPQAGVNVANAMKGNVSLSGVLPGDWRRGGAFKWLPAKSGYMWGGMSGLVVTAVLLHRAGWLPFDAGDNAIVRAMDMLHGTGLAAKNSPVFRYPAEGDDTWIPWVVNAYAGTNYPTTTAQSGKNMGYTDWTHASGVVVDPEEPPVDPEDPPVDPEEPPVGPADSLLVTGSEADLFALKTFINSRPGSLRVA